MRFRILSLFVAIQVVSFAFWTVFFKPANAETDKVQRGQVHASSDTSNLATTTPSFHFSSRNMEQEARFINSIKTNQIETALQKMPANHVESVKNIILDYNQEAHRGLGGNSLIILRAVNMTTEEMIGVLIHELGHNVDLGTLTPKKEDKKSSFKDGELPIYESDPSLDFYRISWISNHERKKNAVNADFVSGYAMTDPFEDFAETYVYYVLHNNDFKALSSSSDALYAKYRFMKYEVFDGVEFNTGDGQVKAEQRPWDITVLSYDINQFLE